MGRFKRTSMTTEADELRAELRALMASPAIGLPSYGDDAVIRRRVGVMIAKCAAAKRKDELALQTEPPSK